MSPSTRTKPGAPPLYEHCGRPVPVGRRQEEHRHRLDERPDLLQRPSRPEHALEAVGQAPRVEAILQLARRRAVGVDHGRHHPPLVPWASRQVGAWRRRGDRYHPRPMSDIDARRRRGQRPDGLGHRRGVRPRRPRRRRPRGRRRRRRGRPAAADDIARPRRPLGQAHRGRTRRGARATSRSPPTSASSPTASSSSRPSSRTRPPKVDVFRALDEVVTDPAGDPRQQHQLDPDHEAGHRHQAARAGHRHPLLQPRAGAAPRRAGHQPDDVAGDDHHRRSLRHRGARQEGHPQPGPRRVRRQRPADPVHPLGDPDDGVRLRHGRGHRHRHGRGLQPPDGAAAPRRPDRPRHDAGRRREPLRGVQGAAVRAAADALAHGRGRAARAARPDGASTTTRRPDRGGHA